MPDILHDLLWTEKYRPTSLDQVALDAETRQVLDSYLQAGEIPHLLLVGPAGSGKTTVARILYQALDCAVLPLNASAERGIEVVRNKIGSFVAGILSGRWNVVFLDEADAMTSDAQTALRNLIESNTDRARFILTANYGHRIIGPIQSRCQLLVFDRPPLKERARILIEILKAEQIPAEVPVIFSYAERYPDLRQMLFAAQHAYLAHKMLPMATTVGGPGGTEMLTWVQQKNWTAFKRFSIGGDFDPQQALRDLFYAIPDDHPKAGFLRHVVGRGVHETGFTPDPVVLFLAVAAEAMEGC